jgi:hypothetical protein
MYITTKYAQQSSLIQPQTSILERRLPAYQRLSPGGAKSERQKREDA